MTLTDAEQGNQMYIQENSEDVRFFPESTESTECVQFIYYDTGKSSEWWMLRNEFEITIFLNQPSSPPE